MSGATPVKSAVRKTYPDGVAFSSVATPEPSSKFEVTVNGVLVHTKIGDGELLPAGFPDSAEKLGKVLTAIQAAME
ncbi:hypothetical protein FOA52_013486 [Chlamydomonas sp. UWO 241]|nr:hypothetical protein FOA52_013486 [Chlamydomonas sp. UWO 241]